MNFVIPAIIGFGAEVGRVLSGHYQRQAQEEHEARVHAEEEAKRQREQAERLRLEAEKREEEARRLREEAEENRRITQRRAEEDERRREEAERQQQEERRLREEEHRRAEEAKRQREEEQRLREEAERQRDLERQLRELGIAPDIEITADEIASVRREISWKEGCTHICITGNRGVGKSTLSNALRGLHPSALEAAPVGEVEMTMGRNRYIDPLHENIVWYDVPGAGTKNVSAWQYYYDQKLFVYDKIVLVHISTLTETDLRILKVCKLRDQECIVVRSQADIHCRNRARRLRESPTKAIEGYKSDVAADTAKTNKYLQESKTADELKPFVTDYIISEMGIYQLITREDPSVDPYEQVIDDALLLQRLSL